MQWFRHLWTDGRSTVLLWTVCHLQKVIFLCSRIDLAWKRAVSKLHFARASLLKTKFVCVCSCFVSLHRVLALFFNRCIFSFV
jgi:hypothetical protein